MKYFLLLVIVALTQFKGLDGSAHSLVPRSSEGTPPHGNVGSCYTWGRGAFRTFQDDFFYFTSKCNFILSRQCKGPSEDFNVQIRRGSNGNLEYVHIQIEGVSIIMKNETVTVKDVIIKLPYDDKIIVIQKYGIYTRISNRKHAISVIWNHRDSLSITLDTKYKNQTCGLCGSFQEGTGINSDSNDAIYNIMIANQLDVLGHVCVSDQPTGSTCTAAVSCISPISIYFSTCLENPTFANKYLKLCQKDVCACGNKEECACSTFEELSRQCTNLPVISDNTEMFFGMNWKEWRSKVSCVSPDCPENQFYKECGAMCVPSCSDPETQQQCDQCVNACECPEDTVLDDIRGTGRCISKTACPCEYSGMIYTPGQIRHTSCHSCVCQSGMWECSDISCPGRCKIEEGTHFTTFDNKYYTLKGDCSYYAVVTKTWTIKIELRPCQIAFKQTCLQRVVFTNNQTWYAFTNDGNVYSEGNKVGLPLGGGDITIFRQSSMFLQVATNSGMKMQVQTSPIMQLYISLPEDAQGSTKGLCGTFNDNANDDFLSAHNIVEDAPLTFANSWVAENNCPETTILVPCVSSENEHYAKQHCSYLKDPADAFSVCHSTVDYMKYYQMCAAATCACENINDCLCAALGAYVHECATNGIIIRNWRRDICSTLCRSSLVFENDMRTCNRTCRSLSENDYTCAVKDVPVYGCGCPEGKYMDESGDCVDRSDCPCYTERRLIEKGQSINLHGRLCICQDGKLNCFQVTAGPLPPACPNGKVFFDCANDAAPSSEYLCERTCRTLNTPCIPCIPDCVCPHGLVEDDDGNCIARENCPCLFSGEVYTDGRIIQRDCNKCTCQGGSWNCTNKACPKTCEVYGDGHYVTFDGKRYVYDGNCEYTFVEDQCNRREGTLQILTDSVPCCERGMTCSRNIRILLEGKELILKDNHVETIEKSPNQTHCTDDFYSLHTVGLYLILTFPNGITVIWDKSTRLSITLDSRWKNNVCGLCGNFNDDVSDDLTTKGNSLVTSAVEFGNSWKSMTCSDTVNQTSPCDRNPYCLAWAQRKCGIIKHVIFQSCHKKVDPTSFYDACVQEACACDLEGKFLGFCTAVAVYAEACNKAGVCIDWRTPERCPVYCDYYNSPGECSWHYQPCGTLTTKTCSDHYIGKKYSAVLEGCYAKCPGNAPYLDENKMKCVNLPECTCYYNGKILEPGERSNDCRNCVCIDGNMNCTGTPTTSRPTTTSLSTISTTEWNCDGEWSQWFNENTPTLQNRADTELLNLMRSPLCPFSPYQITAIQCEALKFPQRPISEMKDNVTCNKETGLVCTYNQQTSDGGLMCLDYRIRVCCQSLLTSTSQTTQTPLTTTATPVQTTPTSTRTTVQTTPTSTRTTVQTTPTSTSTTVQTTPTSTSTTVQTTPTSTSTTVQTTPTSTSTTVQTTPTSTSTTVQTTPTSTRTTVQTTPTSTSTTGQTTPTSTSTTVQTTPTSTSTTVQTTPTSTRTTVQTPTSTSTTGQTTPTSTSTTGQTTPTSTSTTAQTTPTSTSTTVQTTPTSTSTTVQTPTSTSTTVQTTPTSTSTTVQTPTSTRTTVQTPTSTSTTVQTPTSTSTTVQTTPTSTSTTVQTTPTSTSTTVQTQTSTSTTVQTTPTSASTTVQTTPTSTSTTVQTTPTSTRTTVQTPTSTSTTGQTTPTSTSTTGQTTPTSTSTTGQTTPTSTSTTVQTTPTSTSTTVQTTPTSTRTTVQTPTSTSTTGQTTPTSTSTTGQTTPTSTSTTVQTTPTSTSTTVQTTPTSTSTTVQTTPTSTSTTVQTQTSTSTTVQTQTSTSTTVQTTPTSASTTVQTTPTSASTTVQTTPTSTTVQTTPTSTTVQTTPTSTSTTVQTTPTSASTTVQTTPTSASTTVQTTPTSASTTVQTQTSTSTTVQTQTSTSTTVQTTPTSASTTVQTTPTSASTTVQTTPTSASTTVQTTPTSASTTVQTTPTSTTVQTTPTSTTVQTTPTSTTVQTTPTSTTVQTTPTSTTVQTTPTSTSTTVQTTPTSASTTVQTTPTSASTTVQTTPTSASTTVQTQTSTSTTVQTTPTSTSTTVQTTPTSTSTTVQTTPTSTSTTVQTQTSTSTTVQTTPTSASTTVQTTPTSASTTVQTTPTFTSTRGQTTTLCLPVPKPTCQKPSRVLDENGCEIWDCYCQCQVWGDPHYLTFGGTQYDFFNNCTYTLVEEQVPKYNFSVLVDNYFCFTDVELSCARGIIMFYNESVVTITTGDQRQITFDGDIVTVPYSLNGINIHSMHQNIYISIPDIQASIMSFGDTFQIRLSQKYFLNNTRGQCGVCVDHGVDECVKRNGEIMPPDCCHITADDWKVYDPNKPYCELNRINQTCSTPSPIPPTCHPADTMCGLILGKPFEDCRKQSNEDVKHYYSSCLFDHCNTNSSKFDCSSLQAFAIACKNRDICVDWRNFTNGYCNYTCPEGFIYKPCEHQDNDYCENTTLIHGEKLYPFSEGCFCPKGMMLSENKTTCVNSCCRDNSGNPRHEGETWMHATNTCTSYTCFESQVVTSEKPCDCMAAKFWTDDYCSHRCGKEYGHCKMMSFSKNVTKENSNCSAEVMVTSCEGSCPGRSEFDIVTYTMINECSCCKATKTENSTVNLDCGNGDSIPYTYTYISSCDCIANTCYN
ncbi:mucin-2-like isoform X2 [Heterodontus francisci]|uniref:mucin-2-like isoform X2 n=1 Tax=Heterodontus francisci TaxID=7792 RepID=UPI00355B5777